MSVVITGSIAYDYIMSFPGFFKDHILPEKIHEISVSFLVDSMKKQRGGIATNIAYNLALLGERLFVADSQRHAVFGFDLQGRFVTRFGQRGTGPGEFNRPEGLCVDVQDRLYVADSCNHRIQIFAPDGKLIRTYGRAGSGLGELSYPYDIAVDGNGFQFVCEFGNSRIQVLDANDEPVEIIGGPGAAPGRFNNPWAVALDSQGNLYVADALNHRVQKLIRRQPFWSGRREAS